MSSLAVVPRRQTNHEIIVSAGGRDWDFAFNPGGKHHFWSTDGVACLWCRMERSEEEITDWLTEGVSAEPCGRVGLIDVKLKGKKCTNTQ